MGGQCLGVRYWTSRQSSDPVPDLETLSVEVLYLPPRQPCEDCLEDLVVCLSILRRPHCWILCAGLPEVEGTQDISRHSGDMPVKPMWPEGDSQTTNIPTDLFSHININKYSRAATIHCPLGTFAVWPVANLLILSPATFSKTPRHANFLEPVIVPKIGTKFPRLRTCLVVIHFWWKFVWFTFGTLLMDLYLRIHIRNERQYMLNRPWALSIKLSQIQSKRVCTILLYPHRELYRIATRVTICSPNTCT